MEGLDSQDPHWIGGYRLLARLGEGGMGRVYLARSERGRTVAVKAVKAELAQHPDFRRRFAHEIAAARRVGKAFTAPVLDADTDAPAPWVATGYIAGPSLAQVVSKDYGRLPERSVLALATGLVRALEAIHGAGLVHRDLKPSNILITIDGPRVIDFGIARAVDEALQSSGGLTGTGQIIGSPGFMSPEQVRGETVTAASDIFCLGAVLAYAASGRMPFGSAESGVHALLFRIAEEEPDLSDITGPVLDLITGCLAKRPEDRPTLADLAARTGDDITETWLPGEVLAQLGRHAVSLLDSEDPLTAAVREAVADAPGAAPANIAAAPTQTAPEGAFGSPPPSAPYVGGPTPGTYGPPQQPWQPHTGYQTASPYAPRPAPHTVAGPTVAPHHPAGRPIRPPQSPQGFGTATWIAMGAMAVWTLIDVIWSMWAYGKLDGVDSMPAQLASNYDGLKTASMIMSAFAVLAQLPVIVLWLIWFSRLRTNAEALHPGSQRFGAGMAVGAWFIPIGNFFLPKQIVNDIWAVSAPMAPPAWAGNRTRPPALVNGWWTLWVVSGFFTFLMSWEEWYDADTVSSAQGGLVVRAFAGMITFAAAVLAIQVIVRLTRIQQLHIAANR